MSGANLDLFDDAPDLPPRSELYALPMQGGGTCRQESLLSYLHRLARAHRIRPIDLVTQKIVPLSSIAGAKFTFGFSENRGRTTNGCGKYALEIADALSRLTTVKHLTAGTFLPWANLFNPLGAGMLHAERRWCPSCLAETEDDLNGVVHHLLWSCHVVKHCGVHLCSLVSRCPWCAATQSFVADTTSYGRCRACHRPLGQRSGLWDGSTISPRERLALDTVSRMVAMGADANEFVQNASIARGLKSMADVHYGGALARLEKALGAGKRTVYQWAAKSAKPKFDNFLDVCEKMRVDPLEFISPSFDAEQHSGAFEGVSPRVRRPKATVSDATRVRLIEWVRKVVSDGTYSTLKEAARVHGISISTFKYRFPAEYRQLAEHWRKMRRARTEARLQRDCRKAAEMTRHLYSVSTRITRLRLDTGLRTIGLTLKDPVVRKAAFDELARLRSGLDNVFAQPPPGDCRG